jgi:DNA topoisomerase-2
MSTTSTDLSQKYQKKTDKQHILDNPDTYIGSIEEVDTDAWILSETNDKIIQKNIRYIPGLYKLFDEGIVNCRDHVIRMKQAVTNKAPNAIEVSNIDIQIDDDGTITMFNDGNGIDVEKHPEYNIWIPEMIFGHLRTSTNYDKTEKKIVGGKNGFGFKLVLIWSSIGSIETVDHVRGLKYCQTFRNNLDEICPPVITKCKTKPYTKITFKPDYQRLGLGLNNTKNLDPDMVALLRKRVYDIAAVTDKTMKIKYNSQPIPVKNFQQYIDMYIGSKQDAPRVYEENESNIRWEYAVALSPTHEFIQISFVNGIYTSKGGKHVEYILNQITRKLCAFIEKKKKISVNPNSIKEQLMLFLRCDIENPAFDSQTKDFMNTPSSKFGSNCTVSDKFIEKIAKMGVMDAACALTEIKENKAAKKTDGSKTKTIRGIPKLIDANWAGTEKSAQCTIILCEGDSAKAGIVSGLSSEDRNIIGVYPMKGKILNVRGENTKKISENKEIAEIKKILGLESGRKYKDLQDAHKNLRYGKVLFMTDQDDDGSHIKGLGINMFECEWGSLLEIPGFIGFMNTPILKARKGANQELVFYNNGEYESWKQGQQNGSLDGWKIKYYKGLGTSTGKEFREYFEKKKIVGFEFSNETSSNIIDMVFNKKRSDDRKEWLEKYDRTSYLDTSKSQVSYDDFINKELIHFSKYDCDRSIPNLMDGLKISLRKILYSAFKKKLNTEIKVAQFSGYVSEHSGYHHGEASLNAAIVGMAQNYVGSNNINLLVPSGQFGTRLQGGKDSASERYIFTYLNTITRMIYRENDDAILKYLDDDGFLVEPIFYAPIIPMILVNGTKGIGTGFSTDIMCYNPREIIQYLKNKLTNLTNYTPTAGQSPTQEFIPYYEGFKGTIIKIQSDGTTTPNNTTSPKFLIKGKYEVVGPDKIRITELPIGTWTDDYKEFLESLIDSVDKSGKKTTPIIKDYDDMSKDTSVEFIVTLTKGKLAELEAVKHDHGCNGIEKSFKLYTTNSTSNMNLFDAKDKLKKYTHVSDIIDDYYITRLEMYQTRKSYMIDAIEKLLVVLSNKTRYIKEILDDVIDLRKKSKADVVKMLTDRGYVSQTQQTQNSESENGEEASGSGTGNTNLNGFNYLIKMTMDSVTSENVDRLSKEYQSKQTELENIKNKTIQTMWLEELNELLLEYNQYKESRCNNMERKETNKIVKKVKKVVKPTATTKPLALEIE